MSMERPLKRARDDGTTDAAAVPDATPAPLLASTRGEGCLRLFEQRSLCDGEVRCGDHTFPVSRMLLAAASPFFLAAFTSSMREDMSRIVELDPTLSIPCVEALLRHAHMAGTGNTANWASLLEQRCEGSTMEDLVCAADLLGFAEVLPTCSARLITSLNVSNCISRLLLAERYRLRELAAGCTGIICAGLGEDAALSANVALRDGLVALPRDAMALFLSQDPLPLPEEQLYELLDAWRQYQPPSRSPTDRTAQFDDLLELIRLPSLGMSYLSEHVMYSPVVLNSARAQKLVREAARYLGAKTLDERRAFTAPNVKPRRPLMCQLLKEDDEPLDSDEKSEGCSVRFTGGATFRVFPDPGATGSHSEPMGITEANHNRTFEIPEGWTLVTTNDEDFEVVRANVISKFRWHTDVVIVGTNDHGGTKGYGAYEYDDEAGEEYDGGSDMVECGLLKVIEHGSKYKLESTSLRLLFRRSHEPAPFDDIVRTLFTRKLTGTLKLTPPAASSAGRSEAGPSS